MKKTSFGIFLATRGKLKSFSVVGSIITILFFIFINFSTSKGYLWFIYPAFAVLWWPLSVFFASKGKIKSFSVAGSLLLMAFLITDNIMFSPMFPWVIFTILPVFWWPVTVLLGRRAASFGFASVSFFITMLYYGLLNFYMFPAHPWLIYIAYALIWWPLTQFFMKRKQLFAYSVVEALITIIFFMAVNLITTPHNSWFIYPSFTVLWWPLSIYFFVFKKKNA
jgi:hypothetical protein